MLGQRGQVRPWHSPGVLCDYFMSQSRSCGCSSLAQPARMLRALQGRSELSPNSILSSNSITTTATRHNFQPGLPGCCQGLGRAGKKLLAGLELGMFPVAQGRGWAQLTEQGMLSTPEGLSEGIHPGHSLLLLHFREGTRKDWGRTLGWENAWRDWEELCCGHGEHKLQGLCQCWVFPQLL